MAINSGQQGDAKAALEAAGIPGDYLDVVVAALAGAGVVVSESGSPAGLVDSAESARYALAGERGVYIVEVELPGGGSALYFERVGDGGAVERW